MTPGKMKLLMFKGHTGNLQTIVHASRVILTFVMCWPDVIKSAAIFFVDRIPYVVYKYTLQEVAFISLESLLFTSALHT